LRQKDILIQDNLIKFSTFLQQQKLRKEKDLGHTKEELKNIYDLEEEIKWKKEQLKMYKALSEKIERKVSQMRKYEKFLERVKDANPDEFAELQDILSRYKHLMAKNEELKNKQREYTDEHEFISRQLSEFENKMAVQQTLINNNMSKQ
jgi:chromosome segregation ATPase